MLAQKSCTPCQGGVPKLATEAAETLRAEVPEWKLREAPDRIERTFRFADFAGAFALVSKVAALAEDEGHHPDIAFGWGYATITLYTHKIKGLHENDFIMAAKIDQLAEA